ncbi:MAG: site-2 protease family protein [Clostridia bacterium]|nr:site-2 protease family protein [Clostridia bacterium]
MLFAFFHELGHLFTGLFLGFKPYSLGINPLGLSINFEINARDYNKKVIKGNMLALKKLIIALGGPFVNFVLVIFFLMLDQDLLGVSKEFLVYANILIGLFNLIPIYPLDGGRILKNVLHILTGLESTYSYTNLISNISIIILTMFSSICILYLKNIAVVLIVGYLWYLVINENKLYNQRMKIYEIIKETM